VVLVQLLLPTVLPKGAAVDGATAALVARRELAETLDRVTAYFRSPRRIPGHQMAMRSKTMW
jgi:hypothetical protein